MSFLSTLSFPILFCNFTHTAFEAGMKRWTGGSVRFEKPFPESLTATMWVEFGFHRV